MKNYFMLSLAVSAFSQMASAVTIPCNTDGVVHDLKFNQEISTDQGSFYSFTGQTKGKKIHLLYPTKKEQKISLSVLNTDEKKPLIEIFESGERSIRIKNCDLDITCTNPTVFNEKFLVDAELESKKIQKESTPDKIDGNFLEVVNSKYKARKIDELVAEAKKNSEVNEEELRSHLDKYLIATGVNYDNKEKKKMGTFSISWGYHRSVYAQSDMHIWNEKTGTDFVAQDVDAVDFPGFDQILPRKGYTYNFDVPQYQARIAYMLPNGKWGIELSQEHLKYKMKQRDADENFIGQDKHIDGNYFGQQNPGTVNIAKDEEFYLEHTDGLNPISVNIIRNVNLTSGKLGSIDLQGTVGAGIILPATLSVMKGEFRDDKFSIVGYDTSVAGRIRYTAGPVFLQAGAKYHHINVVKGKLAGDHNLHQYINALVFSADIGVNLNFNKKAKK